MPHFPIKFKKYFPYIALVFVALLIGFVLLEVVIRASGTKRDPILACRESDTDLHHKLKPNSKCSSKTGEWNVTYEINSLGIRNSDISPKTSDEFRILVLGDSFTEGIGVEAEDRFTSVIDKELKKVDKKIVVINAGISTYSPILELEFLKKNFDAIKPDLVMLGFDMTDFKDEIGYYNFLNEKNKVSVIQKEIPTDIQKSDSVIQKEIPTDIQKSDKDYISVVTQINQNQADIQTFKRETGWQKNKSLPFSTRVKMFLRKSKLYVAITNIIKDMMNKPYLAYGSPPFIEGDIETDIFAVVRPNLAEDVYENIWRLPKKSFTQIAELSKEKGVKLVFFTYPHAMQLDGAGWAKGRLTRGFVRGKVYSTRPLDDLVAAGEELSIPSFSLLEDFQAASGKLYFDWDGHFTKLGHEVAGKGLSRFILEKNLVN